MVVFATQWTTEGADVPDLSLPLGQDALIAAVAAANPATVVVLETGGPVAMPWLEQVGAVLAAWYPGVRGGEAIARVLFGRVNPSGRLPISFPAALDQLPHPILPGAGGRWLGPAGPRTNLAEAPDFEAPHPEGADVGYRWHARQGTAPLFAFGHGLSYTAFAYTDLAVPADGTARVTVTNEGDRDGSHVVQLYLAAPRRLIGWTRLDLRAGEHRAVTITPDPRLLSDWHEPTRSWRRIPGPLTFAIGTTALDLVLSATLAGS